VTSETEPRFAFGAVGGVASARSSGTVYGTVPPPPWLLVAQAEERAARRRRQRASWVNSLRVAIATFLAERPKALLIAIRRHIRRARPKPHKREMSNMTNLVKTQRHPPEIAAANADLASAINALQEAQARVDRLRAILANATDAEAALHRAVAADGGHTLGRFSHGDDAPDIAPLVEAAERTGQAGKVAKAALPAAHEALVAAEARVSELQAARRQAVVATLMEQGEEVARKYDAKIEELMETIASLNGLAKVMATVAPDQNVKLIEAPVELPSYGFAALRPSDGSYQTYIRRSPDAALVERYAASWRTLAERLEGRSR
jgi:hypothetical protein